MPSTHDVVTDAEHCYRAVLGRDRRFDGVFYTGVKTTGIYCRPSCPAVTPLRKNVTFYVTSAAAQLAGFRACRRCRPDLTPGSPQWDVRADVAGRAMRMIADGVVEREGVTGLAARAGYTPRHLNRVLTSHLGAGPLSLARAQRSHTARILIETTDMGLADVAFAAGFASVRQFNATIVEVYGATPSQLRHPRRPNQGRHAPGHISVSLPVRQPFDADGLLDFLARRAVSGIEVCYGSTYARTLRLPTGPGTVSLTTHADRVECTLRLADLRDLVAAVERCRRLLDLDADPVAIDDQLSQDPALAPHVASRPGVRVPGHVDGFEAAVRAIIGQQISVAAACSVAGRLVSEYGAPLPGAEPLSGGSSTVGESLPDGPSALGVASTCGGALTRLFPTPEALAGADPDKFRMPKPRGRALVRMAAAVAAGEVVLDRSADRDDVRAALLQLPGIGPWTADYIALRALGDPDVFLPTDLGVRQGMERLGLAGDAGSVAQRWRPWRSYALMHVWRTGSEESKK